MSPAAQVPLPVLPCACANLRRAARAVTRLYEQQLRATGLEPTQYTLLMALGIKGETTQGELGALLAIDSTTLTRVLALLIRRGWIAARPGLDRRQRLLSLSTSGRQKLKQSQAHWERAQQHLKEALGEPAWSQMGKLLADVTRAAAQG